MADHPPDLRLVRNNHEHAALTTTRQYVHHDDDRRHRETDEKHRIDWQKTTTSTYRLIWKIVGGEPDGFTRGAGGAFFRRRR